LDSQGLNKAIREPHYAQKLEDVLPRLSKAKVFRKLDARSGYRNVVLDEESQLLTTLYTESPFSWCFFPGLPYGLISAQDIFESPMKDSQA